MEEKAHIKWACRRGMLELDVIIMPFYEECFDSLNEQEQQEFSSLLECSDHELFTWIMKPGQSDAPAHLNMVNKLVSHNLSRTSRL